MIDISFLDHLNPAHGQFRYLVDLLVGLSQIGSELGLVILGSRPKPIPDIARTLDSSRWQYRPVPRWQFRGAYYLDYLRYAWLLRRERPDVFHAIHTFVPVAAPCPIAVTVFDLMYERFPEYLPATRTRQYRLYRLAVRHIARRAICISNTTAGDVETLWHLERPRITVVPLGTDVDRWARLAKDPAPSIDRLTNAGPTIVSVYNLEPRKNLVTLLRAVGLLRQDFPDLRLILFGCGAVTPEREATFRNTVRGLDLGSTVVECGVLGDAELARLYARGTVFVFPSLYEGFGLPLLEALACGGCVVARAGSAMAEVVGNAGQLQEVEDPVTVATTLGELLRDANLQAKLRAAAPRRAAGFSLRRMAEGTLSVYQALADSESRSP